MNEQEAVEVLRLCLPIYQNLHDKTKHQLSSDEIEQLGKFKVLWESPLAFEDRVIKKAGMDIYEFAYLGGTIYQLNLEESQA